MRSLVSHGLLLLACIWAGCAHYECEWLDGGGADEYLPAEDGGSADDGGPDGDDRSDNGDGESVDGRSDDGECIPETCNDLDDDCDGQVDEEPAALSCALPHAVASCTAGACSITSCESDFADCDGDPASGCETVTSTLDNCGACGRICALDHAIETCAQGICEIDDCDYGWDDCDLEPSNGCETDILNDLANCWMCGMVCPTYCINGVCVFPCSGADADCDGNLDNNCETNTWSDPNNCGACGRVCNFDHATGRCEVGACEILSCDHGFASCDFLDINGCETSIFSLDNCGACGVACDLDHASESCDTGACLVLECDLGWGDCDSDSANGCEIDSLSDPENCGHCGNLCDTGYHCQDGGCVPD